MKLSTLSRTDDIRPVHELLRRAYGVLARSHGVAYWAAYQDLEVTRKRTAKGDCVLAYLGSELVGTVTLYRKSESLGAPWFEVPGVTSFGLFAVDPDHQGKGIGKALILEVEGRAREWGMRELALDTSKRLPNSIRMYEKLGYRIIEHVQWPQDEFPSVVLSKRLH